MSEHTPGPWVADDKVTGVESISGYQAVNIRAETYRGTRVIAAVGTRVIAAVQNYYRPGAKPPGETVANAKMMAAAPHLAEILESVLDTLEDAAQEGLNAYDPDTERQSKWVLGAIEDIIEALEAAGIEVKR